MDNLTGQLLPEATSLTIANPFEPLSNHHSNHLSDHPSNHPSNHLQTSSNSIAPNDCSGFFANQQTVAHFAQIGLSVEPLASLNAQISELHKNGDQQLAIASSPQQELRPDHLKLFATRTAESLFNHVASFSTSAPGTCEQIVPVSAIQSWFNNYKRKLEVKPDFWMNNSI